MYTHSVTIKSYSRTEEGIMKMGPNGCSGCNVSSHVIVIQAFGDLTVSITICNLHCWLSMTEDSRESWQVTNGNHDYQML